jgi:hypothetical protein
MAQKWKVIWTVNSEYRATFQAEPPREDHVWACAPNWFDFLNGQSAHFQKDDIFYIDNKSFTGFDELIKHLRNTK